MKTLILVLGAVIVATGMNFAQDTKADSKLIATTIIKVESIQCGSCVRTVEKALKKVDGVESAKVDLKKKTATVTYEPAKTDLAKMEHAITQSGYSANDKKADPEAYEKLDECCKISEE